MLVLVEDAPGVALQAQLDARLGCHDYEMSSPKKSVVR